MSDQKITISDVAEALGVSKTTVSRAISGKGRIGETTKKRVMDYIEEHDYRPNAVARGLAQSRTFNICIVMPGDYALAELPFFQRVTAGIQEAAGESGYDILLCICQENDISALERIINNHKADGVILLRTFVKDLQIEFLLGKNVPFVTTGVTTYRGVKQVDNDQKSACRDLTRALLERGMQRIALFGGPDSHVVTQSRLSGYREAFAGAHVPEESGLIFLNLVNGNQVNPAVERAIAGRADCIVCMDDAICGHVLRKLRQEHVSVPGDIRVASYYDSSVLEDNDPSVTSLTFDAKALGVEACRNLSAQIEGEEVPQVTLLPYRVELRESTR